MGGWTAGWVSELTGGLMGGIGGTFVTKHLCFDLC